MFVFCEKLILVPDPLRGEWWNRLLGPRQSLFCGRERCEKARDEEDAVAKALQAREEGFRPILFCPSAASRERAGALFRAQRKSVGMLVGGYDDSAIRALLTSPSREVLLALAGKQTLIEPSKAYMDALQEALGAHRVAREFMQTVKNTELRLEDFHLVEEAGQGTGPVWQYSFEWRLDPAQRLTVVLNPLQHAARVAYTVDGRPQAGSIQVAAEEEWQFDATGECEIKGRDLQRIAETFEIEDDSLRRWDDAEHGPLIPDETLRNVQAWLKEGTEWSAEALNSVVPGVKSPMPLLNSSQWKTAFAALGAAEAAPESDTAAQTAITAGDAAPSPETQRLSPNELKTPLLLLVPGEFELLFNVNWEPRGKPGRQLPERQPDLAIDIDGQAAAQADVHWAEDFQTLAVSGLSLPTFYRYGWAWDGKRNRLQLQIETLPAGDTKSGKTSTR
jgi:hypothetical protein